MLYVFFNAVLVMFDILDLKNHLSITMIPVIFWAFSSISISLFSNLFIKKSCLKIESKKDFCINKSYENEIKKTTVDIIKGISNKNIQQNDSSVYLKNYLLKNLKEYEDNKTTSDNFFLILKNNIKKEIFSKNNILETKKINNVVEEKVQLNNYYESLINDIKKNKV